MGGVGVLAAEAAYREAAAEQKAQDLTAEQQHRTDHPEPAAELQRGLAGQQVNPVVVVAAGGQGLAEYLRGFTDLLALLSGVGDGQ